MDPDATLAVALDETRPVHERQDAVHDLARWIERGGFLPAMWSGLDRAEARALCEALL